ncbi:hypothetical protein ACHAWX_005238 [Stephanocyclus meneghinianus]
MNASRASPIPSCVDVAGSAFSAVCVGDTIFLSLSSSSPLMSQRPLLLFLVSGSASSTIKLPFFADGGGPMSETEAVFNSSMSNKGRDDAATPPSSSSPRSPPSVFSSNTTLPLRRTFFRPLIFPNPNPILTFAAGGGADSFVSCFTVWKPAFTICCCCCCCCCCWRFRHASRRLHAMDEE